MLRRNKLHEDFIPISVKTSYPKLSESLRV